MKKLIILFLLSTSTFSQVGINTNNPQAVLDITSIDSGILTPRLSNSQRNSIANPVNSLLIYNSDSNEFQYYLNGIWKNISSEVNFSLNETIIGKSWIDGKPIYRRVYPINFLVGNNQNFTIAVNFGIKYFWKISLANINTQGGCEGLIENIKLNWNLSSNFYIYVNSLITFKTIKWLTTQGNNTFEIIYDNTHYQPINNNYYLSIEYTKTTD